MLPASVSRTARNALVTGTYYDRLTAAKIAGGASAPIIIFFRPLYASGYTSAELGNANSNFRQQVEVKKTTYTSVKGLSDTLKGKHIVNLLDMNYNFKAALAAVRAHEAAKILNATDGEDMDSKKSKQGLNAFKMMAAHMCPVEQFCPGSARNLHNSYSVQPGASPQDAPPERHVGSKSKHVPNPKESLTTGPATNLIESFGLYRMPYGLVYGNQFLICRTASATWDPQQEAANVKAGTTCASIWAPNQSAQNRFRYCTKKCKAPNAHERVAHDDDITDISTQREVTGWQELTDPSTWGHVTGANKLDRYAAAFKKRVD